MLNLAKELSLNKRELSEFVNGITSVLLERFKKPIAEGLITLPEAIKLALTKYIEIQKNMSLQLLTGSTNHKRKINIMSDIILDEVYNSLRELPTPKEPKYYR